ncbi:alpha-galactosidase [Physcia stellaris]|nr:alpha-galactosidase [Physcia stellaris]
MAEIAFGVVGVVGVVFQVSGATCTFLSSIIGAPKSIKTLASHIESLKFFLEAFNTVVSKPEIRERAQNLTWLPSVYAPGSSAPVWGGLGSWPRIKYAFNKSSLLEIQAALLGRVAALHLTMEPMDLSWTADLTQSDRESIHILQQRASNLVTGSAEWRSSETSLASQRSARSWAGIGSLIHVAQDVSPDFSHGESETDLTGDDDPFRRTLVLEATGSDGLQRSVTLAAILYFGGQENFVDQSVVTALDASIKRHPTVEFQGSDGKCFGFEKSVTLSVRLRDEPEATATDFLIIPYMGDHEPLFKVSLGAEWLKKRGFQIKFT